MKKKFKMPSAPTTLFIIVIFVAILTWIIPAGQYEYKALANGTVEPITGTYHNIPSTRQGLWNIFYAPITGFVNSIQIGLYLIIMNAFITLIMKTGAISAGISCLTKKLLGKEIWLIPILMFLFSLCSTTFGFWEETLGFYMIIVPVFISAGYDAVVGLLVILWGSGLGLIGSTINPFSTGIASSFANISIGDGIVLRLFIYILFFAIGAFYIMRYAKKVKDKPSLSLVFKHKTSNEEYFLKNDASSNNIHITKIHKRVLIVFCSVFVILILSIVPWASKFNINFFNDINNYILSIPVIKDILGPIVPFGNWWFSDLSLLFLIASVIVGFIGKFSEKEFIDTFFNGVNDVMSVVIVIAISNGITVIMNDGNITSTILYYGESILSRLSGTVFACASFLIYLPLSFFIPSSTGLATLSIPLLAPLADFAGIGRDVIITSYQISNSLINLIAPTSAALMGALTITKIPYSTYIKSILKLVVIIVLATLLILYFAAMF